MAVLRWMGVFNGLVRFAIVVITNQAGLPKGDKEGKWKRKIPMIAEGPVRFLSH